MSGQLPLLKVSDRLSTAVSGLFFAPPVTHVYNPLEYARACHTQYLERFGQGRKEALFLGMNPGPFGMGQTGVPFGEIASVRGWMGIQEPVERPGMEHPKRPVDGFQCTRSEVSGRRLWGWARKRFGTPEAFFSRFFVWNYCPLLFLEESGRNRTPDKLPVAEREPLFAACDRALRDVVEALQPRWVIGVGAFAEARARQALEEGDSESPPLQMGRILHPSPASPAANRGWVEQAERELREMGMDVGAYREDD
ncbi:MAG: uracil-DNA glycosylase family protein [Gemmatimonadota bacterium]